MQSGVWKPILHYIGVEGTNVVWYMTKAFHWKKCTAWICNRLYADHHHPKLPVSTQPSYYNVVVGQQCVIECQKHNEVSFLKKYNKVRISKYVTYSHIIYHAYYSKHHNQPAYYIHNVKTSYMLDFHKFFGTRTNADKTRITRKKRG